MATACSTTLNFQAPDFVFLLAPEPDMVWFPSSLATTAAAKRLAASVRDTTWITSSKTSGGALGAEKLYKWNSWRLGKFRTEPAMLEIEQCR